MSEPSCSSDFERDALPHLNSAYNLARWLTHNRQDADDVVQEAYLRAFRFYAGFRGDDARPWLLRIVRNVYYSRMRKNAARESANLEENLAGDDLRSASPEDTLIRYSNGVLLRRAIEALPAPWREVLTLRELQGMSYKEISAIVGVPTGTVMSRLSRARARLSQTVNDLMSVKRQSAAEG